MGPLLLSMVGGVAAATASRLFDAAESGASATASRLFNAAGKPRTPPGLNPVVNEERYNVEVGADDIYIETGYDDETAGDEGDEVGARAKARRRPQPKGGTEAKRRIAFLPPTVIGIGATVPVTPVLNSAFKGIGMRVYGLNVTDLLFNGATIRGKPQEGSAGNVGCAAFVAGESYFWEWDTANPGESFSLSFTNTNAAAVTLRGFLIGYLA